MSDLVPVVVEHTDEGTEEEEGHADAQEREAHQLKKIRALVYALCRKCNKTFIPIGQTDEITIFCNCVKLQSTYFLRILEMDHRMPWLSRMGWKSLLFAQCSSKKDNIQQKK